MKIGTGIAICGIWLGCGLAMYSGNADSDIFGSACIATIFIAIFS